MCRVRDTDESGRAKIVGARDYEIDKQSQETISCEWGANGTGMQLTGFSLCSPLSGAAWLPLLLAGMALTEHLLKKLELRPCYRQ